MCNEDGSENSIPRRGRSALWGGLVVALIFLAVWAPFHSSRPHVPTSDLYTHLSVAKHICQGEGFVTDMTYPLSFAYPFARKLPQPLIHRGPGFPLLLTIPHLAGGGDPHRVLAAVRILQLALLGLLVWIGAAAWLGRGRASNVAPWLVLLGLNPMVAYAVDWGFIELACGVVLLLLWLRLRDGSSPAKRTPWPGLLDGLLIGTLALLRMDLFWVPLVWIIAFRRFESRRPLWALLIFLLMMTPWAVRNYRLSGDPLFSLQNQAELVKMTPRWPEYSVYRQLEPQPAMEAIRKAPGPILRKIARGVKFQVLNLGRLLPLWYWAGASLLLLVIIARRFEFFRLRWPGGPALCRPSESGPPRWAPLAVAGATLALLIVQYSFFDHSLRHLLVLLPILAWELSTWTGEVLVRNVERRIDGYLGRFGRIPSFLVAVAVTAGACSLFPCTLPGWESAARNAAELAPEVTRRVEAVRRGKEDILFVEWPAVPYFCDRSAVWNPTDPEDKNRIKKLVSP